MGLQIVKTLDNSFTLFSSVSGEHYHSLNGAITESEYIFINLGLNYFLPSVSINILEIGYGTGLNALLTYKHSQINNFNVFYNAIDILPVEMEIVLKMGYHNIVELSDKDFQNFYHDWNKLLKLTDKFSLLKQIVSLDDFNTETKFDVIYFDAFSPESQLEMWSEEVFNKLYQILKSGGILVTYSSKGLVKQNLRNAGFFVQRFAGPPGKRHVVRATKL